MQLGSGSCKCGRSRLVRSLHFVLALAPSLSLSLSPPLSLYLWLSLACLLLILLDDVVDVSEAWCLKLHEAASSRFNLEGIGLDYDRPRWCASHSDSRKCSAAVLPLADSGTRPLFGKSSRRKDMADARCGSRYAPTSPWNLINFFSTSLSKQKLIIQKKIETR